VRPFTLSQTALAIATNVHVQAEQHANCGFRAHWHLNNELILTFFQALGKYLFCASFSFFKKNESGCSDEFRDLQALSRAKNASHLSAYHCYCLKGTSIHLLELIENWEDDDDALHVYWLNGHAGSGKSALAWTFSKRMFADDRLGASSFYLCDFPDHSNLQSIFLMLLFQLACKFPEF